MAKRGRKPQLRQLRTYMNPEHPTEAEIAAFVRTAVRQRSSAVVREMLTIAWEQMSTYDRDQFEARFRASHRFESFERIQRSRSESQEADSSLFNSPSPKVK